MKTLDLKKELFFYKEKENEMNIVDIPELTYIMIDGSGDPNKEVYKESIEAMYALAYTIKFAYKKEDKDFVVMPLEGLWYHDDMKLFNANKKDEWKWTSMILMPDYITKEEFEACKQTAFNKKKNNLIKNIRLEKLKEGKCVQTLYIGPYYLETKTIEAIHKHISDSGYKLSGKHHEIYLNDPRKVDPAKYKTIIRQPFTKK